MSTSNCLVAVNSPFNNSLLTYARPPDRELVRGELVYVPLGRRQERGCVLQTRLKNGEWNEKDKIKVIGKQYELGFTLDYEILELFKWVADYYHYPLGQHIFDSLPKPLSKPRPLNEYSGEGLPLDFELNKLQKDCYQKISSRQGFQKWLIHGITGSGKTAVYLSVIRDVLTTGKSVFFLLPEINLTPQFMQLLRRHCPCPIYAYNSSVSNSDRYGLWKHLSKNADPKVIVGVRSSIFLPLKNIGLIVVDEEHDSSFKQEGRCPYNARDVAIKRAQQSNIPVILGSATPALETYHQFQGDERYIVMKERVGQGRLPAINIVDVRKDNDREADFYPFAVESMEKIDSALKKGEQVLVFINRLGFANFMQCRACGHQFCCPNCSTSLKYYKRRSELSCQYCEYKSAAPEQCPECGNMKIIHGGFGTEKLAEVLRNAFPSHSVERFDRDDIKTFAKLNERLDKFHQGEIDILVGTQMISKGHNFKRVNLVLILGVDAQLNFPDFRSNERVYQLMSQVSGRGGRFGGDGEVCIQTLNPANKILSHVKEKDIEFFYSEEIQVRRQCSFPPFSRMAILYFTSKKESLAASWANRVAADLNVLKQRHFRKIDILGPRPALIEKKVNKYTWCLLIRSVDINELHNALKSLRGNFRPHRSVSIKLDIDPLQVH